MTAYSMTVGSLTDVNLVAMTATLQPNPVLLGATLSPITFAFTSTYQQLSLIDAMQKQLTITVIINLTNQLFYMAQLVQIGQTPPYFPPPPGSGPY